MEGIGKYFDTGNTYGAERAAESIKREKGEEAIVTEDFQRQEQKLQA